MTCPSHESVSRTVAGGRRLTIGMSFDPLRELLIVSGPGMCTPRRTGPSRHGGGTRAQIPSTSSGDRAPQAIKIAALCRFHLFFRTPMPRVSVVRDASAGHVRAGSRTPPPPALSAQGGWSPHQWRPAFVLSKALPHKRNSHPPNAPDYWAARSVKGPNETTSPNPPPPINAGCPLPSPRTDGAWPGPCRKSGQPPASSAPPPRGRRRPHPPRSSCGRQPGGQACG